MDLSKYKRKYMTNILIASAPECDERCPYCLSYDHWKCIDASPIEGSYDHEVEYTYKCTNKLSDGFECGAPKVLTFGD